LFKRAIVQKKEGNSSAAFKVLNPVLANNIELNINKDAEINNKHTSPCCFSQGV
jgi:hypothetical protein